MKKHFFKTLALCALMLGATTTFAQMQVPEHLYLVGPAAPTAWNIDIALEMNNEGNGVFTYHGVLFRRQLQFITARNWDGVRIVPPGDGWHLTEAHTYSDQITGVVGSENKFYVAAHGTYDVRVEINNEGKISVAASLVGDPAPQVVMMGGLSGQWDSAFPHISATVYPADAENPDVFVREVVPVPHNECKHLKFIDYPDEWWETNFFVPATVNHNGNVQLVEDGGVYDVVKRRNGEGSLDDFWGFTAEQCDGSTYRITLDLANMKIKFENISKPIIGTGVQTPDVAAVEAFFTGDRLVVKGAAAPIEVYDMAGVRVARSEGETLLMSGMPNGVYVVKSGAFVQKVLK